MQMIQTSTEVQWYWSNDPKPVNRVFAPESPAKQPPVWDRDATLHAVLWVFCKTSWPANQEQLKAAGIDGKVEEYNLS